MWTTSIQFLHAPTHALSSAIASIGGGSSTSGSGSSEHHHVPMTLLAAGTAYKQVQIYDIRASSSSSSTSLASSSRRPVLYTPEHLLSHRITTLCQMHDGNTLAVGDTVGDVHLLDMRKMHSGKQRYGGRSGSGSSSSKSFSSARHRSRKEEIGVGRLVGPGGSIRQLGLHPTLPILSCVGLDRKLWTWDVKTKKMLDCVYLRQRLNCLLVCEDGSWKDHDTEGSGGGGIDYENDGDGRHDKYGGYYDDEKEGRRDMEEEDEVEDYIDSDSDDVRGGVEGRMMNDSTSPDETDSESDDDDDESGESTGSEDGGNISEEEEEEQEKEDEQIPSAKPKKRQRK